MYILLSTFLLGLIFYLAFSFGKFFFYVFHGIKMSQNTSLFEQKGGSPTIGIFGDSTGLGVGASVPEKSLAGLLGNKYPQSTVVNESTNGLYTKEISKVIKRQNHFDLLIICCGGVDVLYLKTMEQIRKDVRELFAIASCKSEKILVATPLNLGLSTAFPWFLRNLFLNRSKKVGRIFEEEAKAFANIFVSNNLGVDSPTLIPAWEVVSAPDRIHPSDVGYSWVFERILSKIEFPT